MKRMATTSSLLNKPLRAQVVAILREEGFQQVDARKAWSWRNDFIWRIRLISARHATAQERRDYEQGQG